MKESSVAEFRILKAASLLAVFDRTSINVWVLFPLTAKFSEPPSPPCGYIIYPCAPEAIKEFDGCALLLFALVETCSLDTGTPLPIPVF